MTDIGNLQSLLNIQPQKNMSDKIFEQISALIHNGELPEGYIFPNETILCEQLSIGRSTIREAYKALELSGYVTRTKRGTIVNGYSTILGATPLKAVVTQSSEQDFFEFRLMLESQTSALAASRASVEELKQLKSLQSQLVSAKMNSDPEKLAELDRQFHELIATASHNPLMITAMAAVSETWNTETKKNFFKATETNPQILTDMIQMHQSILDSIEKRDSENAKQFMIQHITNISL